MGAAIKPTENEEEEEEEEWGFLVVRRTRQDQRTKSKVKSGLS